MIYLIGGAPKTGKSYLAQRSNGRVIELDALMSKWNQSIAEKDFAQKLPVWQSKKENREPTMNDYRQEAKTYWPEIRELIEKQFAREGEIVIEGAQLSPGLLRPWLDSLPKTQRAVINVVFISDQNAPHNQDFVTDAESAGLKVNTRAEAAARF